MLWFRKKSQLETLAVLEERTVKEIPKNIQKQNKAISEAKQAGTAIQRQVGENHFTIMIFQATGGKLREAHK